MFSGTWFAHWTHKTITDIIKDMVARQQTKLTETSGVAHANLALRLLQALLNFAIAQYEKTNGEHLTAENPIHRLSLTRVWNRAKPRRTVIKHHQLSAWYVIRATSQGTRPTHLRRRQEPAQPLYRNLPDAVENRPTLVGNIYGLAIP